MFQDSIRPENVLPLLLDLVEPGTSWVAGLPLEYQANCISTNSALKLIAESARSGTTLVTDDQTGGRGRLGRTWISEPGADITFSVLVHPALPPARGHFLALAAGVAVAEVLEEAFSLQGRVMLKWPNDVLLGGKKVCGILLEACSDSDQIRWAIAGIGLNVNGEPSRLPTSPASARSCPPLSPSPKSADEWQGRLPPVSLKEHLGHAVPRAPLLAALLARLTFWWTGLERASMAAALLAEWRRRDALAGRRVEVFAGPDRSELVATGEAAGIGEEGQLLLRSGEGALVEVFAGDASIVI
jgi:BirA family biotin operon repressor/biotin-[acetyl-CoA-carboxylase] ligase